MAMRISLGSGATLATQVVDGSHYQIISGVTLSPSPNYIGLASVNVGGTLPALSTGTNFIGLATIVAGAAVPVTDNSQSLTVDWNSGATISVAALPAVGVTGLVSLPSGTEVRSLATILNFPATQAVSFNQLVSLASGTEFRSLATILNTVTVTATNLDVRDITSASDSVAAVQSGTWNVGVTGLVSLASGTFVSLNAGTNYIGLATVTMSNAINLSQVTLFPSPNFIGLVTTVPGAVQPVNDNGSSLTVDGTVGVSGLISLASGTFVSINTGTNNIGDVDVASIAAGDNNIGNVDVVTLPAIPTGTNFIGLATVTMSNAINLSQVTLFPSPNYIGLVTAYPGAAFPVTDNGGALTVDNGGAFAVQAAQSGTWNVGLTGLVSLASGTFVSLNAGTNNIGDVDILSIAAGDNNIGNVDVVTLPAIPTGTNYIGLATVTMSNAINLSQVTLFPSPNYIGLVTAYPGAAFPVTDNNGALTVDNGGTFAVQAAQSGTWNVGVTGLISLASGTSVLTSFGGLISLASGTEVRSLATILNWPATVAVTQSGTWDEVGINDSGNSITVDGTVSITGLISLASGTFVSLNAGTNNIGDVDILSIAAGDNNIGNVDIASLPETPVGTKFIGLVTAYPGAAFPVTDNGGSLTIDGSVGFTSNVTLNASNAYIGLATVIPAYISNYTSFATIYSAAGSASLLVPPNGQRWVLKDLMVGALGRNEIKILSGSQELIPYIALATTGGYISNFGDTGLRAKAVNESLSVTLNSAATITIMANVRFE